MNISATNCATSNSTTKGFAACLVSLVLLTSLAVAALSIYWARWQIIDDGVLIADGTLAEFNSPLNQTFRGMGRNFFFSGLYFEAQRYLFKTDIHGFYVVQGIVFIATCWLIYLISSRFGGTQITSSVAVLAFVASSTVPEVIQTLYKLEVRLVLFWLLVVFCLLRFLASLASDPKKSEFRKIAWGNLLASFMFLFVGFFIGKETIALLVPTAALVGVLGLLVARDGQRCYALGLLGFAVLGAVIIGSAIFTNRLLGVASPSQGSYTGNLLYLAGRAEMPERLRNFYSAVPDVLILTAIVNALAVIGLATACFRSGFDLRGVAAGLATAACNAQLFFNVFCWKWIQVYYNYPVAAFGAMAVGLWLPILAWPRVRWGRWAAIGIASIALAGCLGMAINLHFTRSMALRVVTQADMAMLAELAALPPNSRVALTIPPEHESLLNVRQLLKFLFGRDDITIDSSLTSDYLSRTKQDREFMVQPLFGAANWMVSGRGLARFWTISDQERLLTKMVETTPQQWQVVDRIEPTQRYFRSHLNPKEPFEFSYEWRLYQRR
jgi:multisubunit Na+/H+ antiporter MnhC subunit